MDLQKLKRDALKALIGPGLAWSALDRPKEGFSIVLGVPWALRHLLPVNLDFVRRTDLHQLHRLHVVFDRPPRKGGNAFAAEMRGRFPKLPLTFRFHPPVVGRFVELIDQSKFYASMNWTLGLAQCETRYAILHDFDLYPVVPHYFTSLIEAMRTRSLRFTGLEWTEFDGLTPAHALIGTWALGIDVAWLRGSYRPIDCFHAVEQVDGRRFDLDAFTYIESKTAERALVGVVTAKDMAHVRNLCSTYLRFSKGQRFDVVWRLHLMWYLESLCGRPERLDEVIRLMREAPSPRLNVDGRVADFSVTHVTCANVLRDEMVPMERFLFGEPRPKALEFARAFEDFLWRHGRSDPVANPDGSLRWSPDLARRRSVA